VEKAGKANCVLVGFDFPIGVPLSYARIAGIADFLEALTRFGSGEWAGFYEVAGTQAQISLHKPFYPNRPGGTRRLYLVNGLGLKNPEELLRRCDGRTAENRRAACPLFWTLGAQQVGKAAIAGWRDLLAPALLDPRLDLAIWPFSGRLNNLLKPGKIVVAETYPAEFYIHLGLPAWPGVLHKRKQGSRQQQAEAILIMAQTLKILLHQDLIDSISSGFGPDREGEDRFDAAVGLLGMLNILLGNRKLYEPQDASIRSIEGWIFGQNILENPLSD
jgi:hypothetical protein